MKLVSAIVEEFNLRKYYGDEARLTASISDAEDNIIIEVIISIASTFESIDEFYAHVYKSVNEEYTEPGGTEEASPNEVLLETIHRCKGKEFENVVYYNLSNDGRNRTETELEEERRVCYVGVTRTIKNLLVTALKGRYSQFLPELLKNPGFKELSIDKLNSKLSQARMEEQIVQSRIERLKKRIEDIRNSFPELKGEGLKVKSGLFIRTRMGLRLKRIENARNRIRRLQKKVESSGKALDECQDKIDEIRTEVGFRNLLHETQHLNR